MSSMKCEVCSVLFCSVLLVYEISDREFLFEKKRLVVYNDLWDG